MKALVLLFAAALLAFQVQAQPHVGGPAAHASAPDHGAHAAEETELYKGQSSHWGYLSCNFGRGYCLPCHQRCPHGYYYFNDCPGQCQYKCCVSWWH